MKIFQLLLLTLLITTISCTTSDDNMMNGEGSNPGDQNGTITTTEYQNLVRICDNDANALELPAPLMVEANYLKNEYTAEIYFTVLLSEEFRNSLATVIFPSTDAIRAEVDNISISADDTAYEWTIDGERYVYLLTEEGYQIRYYPAGSLAGRELAYMIQQEDCSKVEYLQYVVVEENGKDIGDLEFSYKYQQAGTAKIVYFSNCENDPNSPSYNVRIFEDLSGELSVSENGNVIRTLIWQADGSGSYTILEDGEVVDNGVWQL